VSCDKISSNHLVFLWQVFYCQKAGFDAAVVINYKGEKLINMGTGNDAGAVLIPSLMVQYSTGQFLEDHVVPNKNMTVKLTDDFTYPRWDIYIIPFAIIVGLCVFVTLVFVVVRVVGHQRSVRRWRFPRANLRKIPTKKFKKGEDDFDSCAICLDDYEDGEKLRLLPCSHVYHTKCIDPWLTRGRRQCPICKRRIRNDGTCDMGTEPSANVVDEEAPANESSGEIAGERTPLVMNASRQYTGQSLRQPLGETSRDTALDEEVDEEEDEDVSINVVVAAAAAAVAPTAAAETDINNKVEGPSSSGSSSCELTADVVGEEKDSSVKKFRNKRSSVEAQRAHCGKSIDSEAGRSTLV
jgi:E3 ubiquitin-protein ligase RNF13